MTSKIFSYLTRYYKIIVPKHLIFYYVEDYSPQIKLYTTDVGELKLLFLCVGGEGNEGGAL